MKVLSVAHSDNPAQKSVEPIERLLETMRVPHYTEFVGMIIASQEAPTKQRQISMPMKVASMGVGVRF